MKDVVGKVAVVTGGAGGIGRALVERFTAEGMKAVVADVDADQVATAVHELRADDREVAGVVTDVTSFESVLALRDATLDLYGAVHLLCNNAGISPGADGAIWEHHINDWRWAFEVNVLGVVNGMNVFVPTMIEQDVEGHVVNTTSGNGGFTPLINSGLYAATKSAVTTITEALWGQLREAGAKVSASLLYPSTRTKGILATGLYRGGRNRPARYDRPGAPPKEGRDGLAILEATLADAGIPLTFAPLSEVADVCFRGIVNDTFWITAPSDAQAAKIQARASSQIAMTAPDYLLEGNESYAKMPRIPPTDSTG